MFVNKNQISNGRSFKLNTFVKIVYVIDFENRLFYYHFALSAMYKYLVERLCIGK